MAGFEDKVVSDFRFILDADSHITYATAFNGKSIVRSLKVKNASVRTLTDVVIEVSVSALGQELSQVWRAEVGTFGESTLEFEDLNLDFSTDLLIQQRDSVPAELRVSIKSREGVTADAMWNLSLIHI